MVFSMHVSLRTSGPQEAADDYRASCPSEAERTSSGGSRLGKAICQGKWATLGVVLVLHVEQSATAVRLPVARGARVSRSVWFVQLWGRGCYRGSRCLSSLAKGGPRIAAEGEDEGSS